MKRVLFVDDERPVLDGLRSRLHRQASRWEMAFVESGALAIDAMQQDPYDVIVTDMRMPAMDGAALLKTVGVRWPQTIRIVLSGYADLEQTTRLVPFAHQYLSKPCQPQQLENVIDRCLLLHDVLHRPELRAIVGRLRKLPSPPKIYAALQAIVADESVTLRDVAKLVQSDAALAARVLQIVNSAFFRLAKRISNVEQAVSYLGFAAIRNLTLSVEVFSSWGAAPCAGLNLEELQLHVHAVAAAASSLARKTPIADDAMLAGLLHDIGYWVLAQECPQQFSQAVELAVATGVPLYQAETQIIGASHAEIGAYLLGIWGLPHQVVEAVAHHHQPERVSHSDFDVLAALVLGHSLVPKDDAAAFAAGVPADPRIDESYLQAVKAPFDWDEARQRVAERTQSDEESP